MKAITRYSTTLSFSVLLLLLIVSPVSADDEYPWPEEYTILCSSEQAAGFSWVNGRWKKQNFGNIQRLVVKSKDNYCGHPSNIENDDFIRSTCINVRELGEEYTGLLSNYCKELYSPSNKVIAIYCDEPHMNLSSNGWYHYAYLDTDTSGIDRYKDSQYIEVGKCSMIKP